MTKKDDDFSTETARKCNSEKWRIFCYIFFLSNKNGKCLKSWSGYSDINIKVNCLIGEFFLLYILQKLKILPDQNILFLWNELTELEKNKNSFFCECDTYLVYKNCLYTMYVQWDKGWFLWEYIYHWLFKIEVKIELKISTLSEAIFWNSFDLDFWKSIIERYTFRIKCLYQL